ncbi:MAG: hypothetical protein J6K42_04615 [Clostridia bacterium]|nr:hypothetical protein [Clostridia bacterium]
MLLEKYKNKKVKLLISSDSGTGISDGHLPKESSITSIIVAIGEIIDWDEELIELSNVKMIRMNLFSISGIQHPTSFTAEHENPIGTEEFDTILVNKNKIITYSIMK